MRIALFKYLGNNLQYDVIRREADEEYITAKGGGHVRVSEYVEVEFPPLRSVDVVEKQLHALDDAEQELRNKFQAALSFLEQQRAELRAITVK